MATLQPILPSAHGALTGRLCYPIVMRLLALLLLPALSFARVPHTFQNGDVADADKINQNFEAIDQTGPTVNFAPLYDQIIGVNAKVDIEMQDESGVIYWATVSYLQTAYPRLSELNFLRGAPTLSSISQTIDLGPNANYDFVIVAEDMRGNKTIAEQTFTGPTTNIKQGIYRADPPLTWPYFPCEGLENEFEFLELNLAGPQDSAWPTVRLSTILCNSIGSYAVGVSDTCIDGSGDPFTSSQLIELSTLEVTGPSNWGTSQLLFSADSSQVNVSYSGSVDCSYLGSDFGVITLGPYQATFYRVDQ